MAAGAGYYDANGIWIYGETDPIALFSDTLNKGMTSVSVVQTQNSTNLDFLELEVNNIENQINNINRKGVRFQASATRDLVSGTAYTVGLTGFTYTKSLDTLNWQNPASNPDRITPTISGYYRITVTYQQTTVSSAGTRQVEVFKNTSRIPGGFLSINDASSNLMNMNGSFVVSMNGSTDYFQILRVFQNSGASVNSTVTVTIEYL
jgi:hypothetical protein